MKKTKGLLAAGLLCLAAFLSGCAMTVQQMYCLPRRSEHYEDLQKVMEQAMGTLEYSAPTAGENQQIVQMADLDGDGSSEVLLFARGGEEMPLKILIFAPTEEGYAHVTTIESAGTAFDRVEYAQMDDQPGLELIVGRQVSEKVLGNVSVYSYHGGQPRQLLNTNYIKFLTCDLDADGRCDLFVIQQGLADGERALASVYSMPGNEMERSAQAELSVPAEHLKRIITGTLQSGQRAVFAASAAGENAIVTDVFALLDGGLSNITFSAQGGEGVNTLRNYYVYADDIDQDGVVELPELITLKTPEDEETVSQYMIRWYALTGAGERVEKMYTYHNYLQGWYLELDESSASRIFLLRDADGGYQFHLWEERENRRLLFTIYRLTGDERMNVTQRDELEEVYKTDNVVYAVKLEPSAQDYGLTLDVITKRFHLIQTDWNTGEM